MSIPRTSVPPAMSSRASELPKRPSPITATESASAIRRGASVLNNPNLANGGPFLGVLEQNVAVAQRECGAEGQWTEASEEHQRDEHQLGGHRQVRGDA